MHLPAEALLILHLGSDRRYLLFLPLDGLSHLLRWREREGEATIYLNIRRRARKGVARINTAYLVLAPLEVPQGLAGDSEVSFQLSAGLLDLGPRLLLLREVSQYLHLTARRQ